MTALHRLYAYLFGYFWRDCIRCGKGFGGHQWRSMGQTLPKLGRPGERECVFCPSCADRVEELAW